MAKVRKRIDGQGGQMSLLDLLIKAQEEPATDLAREGGANIQERLRVALCAAIKQCPLSRWEIAGHFSELSFRFSSSWHLTSKSATEINSHRF